MQPALKLEMFETSAMERLEIEETIRVARGDFRSEGGSVIKKEVVAPDESKLSWYSGGPLSLASTQISSQQSVDAPPLQAGLRPISPSVLRSLPLIPAAPTPNHKRPRKQPAGSIKRLRLNDDPTPPQPASSSSAAAASARKPTSARIPKTCPSLAERGLLRMSKDIKEEKLIYHELWFIVPTDYILPDGMHHSDQERAQPTEIPIRILRPTPNVSSVNELLIPAQDIGKLVGIRHGNVSKDVIYKICGTTIATATTASANDRAAVGVHAWGRVMDAPTPSSTKASGWQLQKCIRVDHILPFLSKRKKPAGVDKVLLDGLKAYPFIDASASAPAAAAAASL